MKNIQSYNTFLFETHNNEFYLLFDELVSIDKIYRWGDEVRVDYTKADGSHHSYIGDERDFKEDFIETSDRFDYLPKIEKLPVKNTEKKYNLVFYIGSKKIETLERNLNPKLAFALKDKYSKEPKYRIGVIKAEVI